MVGIKKVPVRSDKREVQALRLQCRQYAIKKLEEEVNSNKYKSEDVTALIAEYVKAVNVQAQKSISVTQFIKIDDKTPEIRQKALGYEMTCINDAYAEKKIDRVTAGKFRSKVVMMQLDARDLL